MTTFRPISLQSNRNIGLFRLVLSITVLGLLSCFAAPVAAQAVLSQQTGAVILVTSLSDSDDTACTLRDAILAANTDDSVGGCPAGDGADTIDLSGLSGTIDLHTPLP